MGKMLRCYDTLSGAYVEVETTEEIVTYVKRSYWREDIQERRYRARTFDLDEFYMDEQDVYEERQAVLDTIIQLYEYERLRNSIAELPSKYKLIIYAIFYDDRSMTDVAKSLGVSVSCVSRKIKRIKEILRQKLIDLE